MCKDHPGSIGDSRIKLGMVERRTKGINRVCTVVVVVGWWLVVSGGFKSENRSFGLAGGEVRMRVEH